MSDRLDPDLARRLGELVELRGTLDELARTAEGQANYMAFLIRRWETIDRATDRVYWFKTAFDPSKLALKTFLTLLKKAEDHRRVPPRTRTVLAAGNRVYGNGKRLKRLWSALGHLGTAAAAASAGGAAVGVAAAGLTLGKDAERAISGRRKSQLRRSMDDLAKAARTFANLVERVDADIERTIDHGMR